MSENSINDPDSGNYSTGLDKVKKNKIIDIDKKTRELIKFGFVFDGNNFSGSENAQRNWMAVDQFRNDLAYPFSVTTKEETEFLITDANHAHLFALVALGTFESHYKSGRALKMAVNNCVDENSVNLIVDLR